MTSSLFSNLTVIDVSLPPVGCDPMYTLYKQLLLVFLFSSAFAGCTCLPLGSCLVLSDETLAFVYLGALKLNILSCVFATWCMMSVSQRDQIRDNPRNSTRLQREVSRDQIRDNQRQGKLRHSESAVSFSNDATVTPPRKQGRAETADNEDDNEDDDDDDDFNDTDPTFDIAYTNDDALKDCDRISSLTNKLCRVDHHICLLKECLDANVVPTGLKWDLSCNVVDKSQTYIEMKWSTVLTDASKTLMKLSLDHYSKIRTMLKNQITEVNSCMCTSGDPLQDSNTSEEVKTRLKSIAARNKVQVLELKQKSYETFYCSLSCLSSLFMRLRLVSVVGEFLWSGQRPGPLTMTFSAFLVIIDIHRACCSEFAVTVMPAIYIDLASH